MQLSGINLRRALVFGIIEQLNDGLLPNGVAAEPLNRNADMAARHGCLDVMRGNELLGSIYVNPGPDGWQLEYEAEAAAPFGWFEDLLARLAPAA